MWNSNDENYQSAVRESIKKAYEKLCDFIIDDYNLVTHDKKYFADEAHPNDDGFAHYGDNLAKELKEIIANL